MNYTKVDLIKDLLNLLVDSIIPVLFGEGCIYAFSRWPEVFLADHSAHHVRIYLHPQMQDCYQEKAESKPNRENLENLKFILNEAILVEDPVGSVTLWRTSSVIHKGLYHTDQLIVSFSLDLLVISSFLPVAFLRCSVYNRRAVLPLLQRTEEVPFLVLCLQPRKLLTHKKE